MLDPAQIQAQSSITVMTNNSYVIDLIMLSIHHSMSFWCKGQLATGQPQQKLLIRYKNLGTFSSAVVLEMNKQI